MDKSSLLHELSRVKRIEKKEYKTLQSRLSKVKTNCREREKPLEQGTLKAKDSQGQAESHNKHGVIFVNPSKINSLKQTDNLNSALSLNQFSFSSTISSQTVSKPKIYLNPNFKSSVLPSFQNHFIKKEDNPTNVDFENTTVHLGASNFNKDITKLKICQKNQESGDGISNEAADSSFAKKIQKIYLNQHFREFVRERSNSSKVVDKKVNNDSAGIETSSKILSPTLLNICTKRVGVSIEVNSSNDGLSSDLFKKPILHVKQDNKINMSLSCESRTKYLANSITDKKIFLNPKFRKRLSSTKVTNSFKSFLTVNRNHTLLDTDLDNIWLNAPTKGSTVKSNQEYGSCKSTTTQSLLDNDQLMNLKNSKIACPRTRTSSTCLVSVSATKVVRRKKSNLKNEPNTTSSPNKLLFLSKTKLVRNALLKNGTDNRSFVKNRLVMENPYLKSKLKSIVTKNNLQNLATDKVSKLSRQSLMSSGCTMDDVPKSKHVTTIKSNNGTSLMFPSHEFVKPSSVTHTTNQSLFLSKTKLVRESLLEEDMRSDKATVKIVANTAAEIKPRTRRVAPNSHLPFLTLHKTNNQWKQNVLSSTNLSNNVFKLPFVTKIKSNNGKSLKVFKNSELPQRCRKASTSEKYSAVLKRKHLLRQQSNNNMLCMLRSKSRKTQFCKINVLVKKKFSQSTCSDKYVYKNNNVTSRRYLTKAAVLKRRGSFVEVQTPIFTDKTKYIKSKYNLIRKRSSYANSSALKGNKDTAPSKLESRFKMKCRMQNRLNNKYCKRKELSIVNIGGVFYRCSRMSLTKNKPRPKQVLQNNNEGTILHIHGQKFKLERNGLTLSCLDKNPRRKRVDIGGVTFISSSSGTSLTRTNYHTARSILVHAKQKSISLLTKKLKKNNEPCLFFHRFGKCSGNKLGTCVRQHDKKNVAVCKKFVQGSCSDVQCLLSHTLSCHNMPTCRHFLAGHCSRDNCLYPHIKVSDNAPICLDFLQGYCQLGDQCTKRHRDICPSFEKGVCPRGKYCPYPHPKFKSGKSFSRLSVLRKKKPPRDAEVVSNSNLRYFDDVNLQKENKLEPEEDHKQADEECIAEDEKDERLFRNRPKLGRLPSFIPLTDDDFCG